VGRGYKITWEAGNSEPGGGEITSDEIYGSDIRTAARQASYDFAQKLVGDTSVSAEVRTELFNELTAALEEPVEGLATDAVVAAGTDVAGSSIMTAVLEAIAAFVLN